jgi:hypothetical protein
MIKEENIFLLLLTKLRKNQNQNLIIFKLKIILKKIKTKIIEMDLLQD